MSITTEQLRERLVKQLEPSFLEITDDSHLHAGHAGAQGGAKHFTVKIVSEQFKGKTTLARHRLVYDAVSDWMKKEIHALAIHASVE